MNIEEPDELLNWLNAQFIADVQKRHGDNMEYVIIWEKGNYAIREYSAICQKRTKKAYRRNNLNGGYSPYFLL